MIWLSKTNTAFPSAEKTDENGILALGGDLSPERLIAAYRNGIFPWYNEGEPITWYCPNPRMVLFFDRLKVSKSLKKTLKKELFTITFNTHFQEVIQACKSIDRKEGFGTWITDDMQKAYLNLHKKGIAKSVEVWQNGKLVGGLYGIDLGTVFCGESMFSRVSNASKVGFVYLVEKLKKEQYKLLDCQVYNEHLASLGAEEIDRDLFLKILQKG
ncbi:leucyl/phenylalanyl-tRNA--protein transferase [Flavicella sp.]|nr:leucyl/phenylalanyl-tRNA--protein transferase [Flavicella sp.]MDA9111755.1 leucyl/phenylalanyl-tRNA--protein transferase [Flavicella sp.]